LDVGLEVGFHLAHVDRGGSFVGSSQHLSLGGISGLLESDLLSLLLFFFLPGSLLSLFLSYLLLVFLLGLLELLLLSLGGFVPLLGQSLGSSNLLNHLSENAAGHDLLLVVHLFLVG
jgi:hypothetical protein